MNLCQRLIGNVFVTTLKVKSEPMRNLPGIKKFCLTVGVVLKVETKEQVQQLILLEELNNCVPEVVSTVEDAAVLAEYVLAH